MRYNFNIITVLGPTAGGKTSFAANLAYQLDTEIISADSRQVYKGMDIGTGKDIEDYTVKNKSIPYHLIDILDAGEKYNVFQYQTACFNAIKHIDSKDKIPILCGGTGLYLESVLKAYDMYKVPENTELREELKHKSLEELADIAKQLRKLHNITQIDTKERAIRTIEIDTFYKENPDKKQNFPEIKSIIFGIRFDRNSQRRRITERLHDRLKNGMIEEVEQLINNGVEPETLIYYGLEYKFITLYLQNEMDYDEMVVKLNIAIHQFAKRQMTWFRRMERNGFSIKWIDGHAPMEQKLERAFYLMKNF